MNKKTEHFLEKIAYKADLLLWFLSIPLLPIILAEFFTELSPEVQLYFKSYYFILWMAFTVEFVLRLILASDKVAYLRENWIDVLVVLTPAFRVFKVFRFMRFPLVVLSDRVLRAFGSLGMNAVYYFVFVGIVTLVGADLALFFEQQDPTTELKTFNDSIWWAIAYLTTAGSSTYIATAGGRIVGIALMTVGFAVFSVLIASIVSFFMKEHAQAAPQDGMLEGIKEQLGLEDIVDRLERIEKKLNE